MPLLSSHILQIDNSTKIGGIQLHGMNLLANGTSPSMFFLLRHVYAATILRYRVSKSTAMLLTFLLSACVHELVMVVVTRKFRFYLFFLQIVQIPMIMLSRLPVIKQNKLMGNVVFWLGLYAGFPLLCVAYVAY